MKKQVIKKQKAGSQQRNMLIAAALLGLAVVVIIAYSLVSRSSGPKTLAAETSVTDAYKIYQQGDAFFLDVREQTEWDEYHAPGTTLIPLGELPSRLADVPKDKPIVVVCRSGNRSKSGRDILQQAGYSNVTSMAGGLTQWRAAGYPIEP